MTKKHILLLTLIFGVTSNIKVLTNDQPKMKFFNKRAESCDQNKENFKKKIETKISDVVNEKKKHPKIIKHFVTKYQEDIREMLLWTNEHYNNKDICEYRDENEALDELNEDIQRISKENELPSWHSQTARLCAWENYDSQTSACKNLAYAYDSFRFHTQGIPETRKIKSLDNQINLHYDDKYTVAFLERAKKRLQDDLQKIDAPLFNALKKSGSQYSLSNTPSYFESLSEKDQKTLINIIEDVVCEKITNFDNLAEEFQKLFYVFHEKASRKHLNEKEALKKLGEDNQRISLHKGNYSWYARTIHLCELEEDYHASSKYNKTSECKKLAQAYNNLRSYSSMHEIKKMNTLQDQINAKSSILSSYTSSNNQPVIAFLEEEKEKLEQEVKRYNNGDIPTSIPSYYGSRSKEDKEELDNIIKNVVRKKTTDTADFAQEFQKIFDVFDEKL